MTYKLQLLVESCAIWKTHDAKRLMAIFMFLAIEK